MLGLPVLHRKLPYEHKSSFVVMHKLYPSTYETMSQDLLELLGNMQLEIQNLHTQQM